MRTAGASRRLRRWLAAAVLSLGAWGGTGSAAAAQEAPLGPVASAAVGAWSEGDADGIGRLLSGSGVALHLLGQSQPAAGARQARAALAELLGRGGGARLVRVEDLGGTPRRGFAELEWVVVEPGSREGLRYVVFLGFVVEPEGWRIVEVRVLR